MNEQQLEKYRHDLAYLRKAAEQTAVDFGRFGYELFFDLFGEVSFDGLKQQLGRQLQVICKKDADRLPGLLYHIDIPEHFLQAGAGCSDPEGLAELILQRELIKVVLRKLYTP